MNDGLNRKLLEKNWRKPLEAADAEALRDWLAQHPEQALDWKAEEALTRAIRSLPDVPVSSNFTAVAVKNAEREAMAQKRQRMFGLGWGLRNWGWVPRISFAALILGAGLFSYVQVENMQRERFAQSVATMSEVAAVPGPEVLRDFDAIRALGGPPAADEELLRLLQ